MIEVNNLHKSFGTIQALKGVTFKAADGQITGLLGPNGAGKTTTLRVLYTLLEPDEGAALIDGLDVRLKTREAQARIGALPDNHGLYPRLTARENIRYFGQIHEIPAKKLEEKINEMVELLDMAEFIDRRTDGFSSGQRMKVAIARALVHDPQNVLLDEPTNGLDVMSTRSMRAFIQGLARQGKCVLFSSHIMQEVSALCDNIVVINDGLVAASGTPDSLRKATGKESLEDAFVAAIGSEEGLAR